MSFDINNQLFDDAIINHLKSIVLIYHILFIKKLETGKTGNP